MGLELAKSLTDYANTLTINYSQYSIWQTYSSSKTLRKLFNIALKLYKILSSYIVYTCTACVLTLGIYISWRIVNYKNKYLLLHVVNIHGMLACIFLMLHTFSFSTKQEFCYSLLTITNSNITLFFGVHSQFSLGDRSSRLMWS